jgi:hypothetical protein
MRFGFSWFNFAHRILFVKRSQYVWARHVYVFDPCTWSVQQSAVLMRYRRFVVRRFGLDREVPRICSLLNRRLSEARSIVNFEDVRQMCQTRWPEFFWEFIESGASIENNARLYNKFALYGAAHGAASTNVIYMQYATVYCEIQSSRPSFFLNLTRAIGVHYVVATIPTMRHYKRKQRNVLDLDTAGLLFSVAMNYVTQRNHSDIKIRRYCL